LFIDLENIVTSLWKIHQQKPDVSAWLDKVRKYGNLAFGRAYGDFSQGSLNVLESDLRIFGIDKFDCPVKQNGQSTVDSNIIMDLYEVALDQPHVRTFVLMAGDSDYIRVVAKLRQRMDKEIVIMGVRGSVSRDLVRAGSIEDTLEPMAERPIDEGRLIRLIDQYEASRRPGTYPTFGYMSQYVSNPRNADIISPLLVQAKLNNLVADGVLAQNMVQLDDDREIRVTRLDRDHPTVIEALGPPPPPRPLARPIEDEEDEDDYDDESDDEPQP
jgi:uncharacterized LabA/DUF88 family protein